MADTWAWTGEWTTTPTSGVPSGDAVMSTPVNESQPLDVKHYDTIELGADGPTAVTFGGVTNAHVVALRTVGGRVIARLTSADGATQSIPVNPHMILIAEDRPITALDVERVAGQLTTVKVFLGERP
jgi:hypothetical protein